MLNHSLLAWLTSSSDWLTDWLHDWLAGWLVADWLTGKDSHPFNQATRLVRILFSGGKKFVSSQVVYIFKTVLLGSFYGIYCLTVCKNTIPQPWQHLKPAVLECRHHAAFRGILIPWLYTSSNANYRQTNGIHFRDKPGSTWSFLNQEPTGNGGCRDWASIIYGAFPPSLLEWLPGSNVLSQPLV